MGSDVCFNEKLTFLHYLNEHYLIYTITILTFASLYGLVWLLGKYTHFEKLKPRLTKASLPRFPYGNFKEIIKHNTSLHVLLWKYYNRFKKKNCKYGGIFVFMKPAVVVVNQSVSADHDQFESVIPQKSILKYNNLEVILHPEVLGDFVKKFNYSARQALPETLLNEDDVSSTFRNFLLEACCAGFGFRPFEMIEEINQLLKTRYETSLKFYLSLCLPFVGTKPNNQHLQDIFMEIVEFRKKNESDDNDLIESFTSLYNHTDYSIADIADELFGCFADTLTFSYSVLMFCLYELAGSTEIQEELKGEIRRFNKKNRQVTYENLEELFYLDAVVKETLRKYPPVATVITKSENPFEWYQVKKGVFFHSTLAVQRDQDFYPNAEQFDPDRFVQTREAQKEIFRPFGIGPAADLRSKLVIIQVKLILCSMFSCLEVRMKDGASKSFKFNPKVWYLTPSEDFQIEFVRIT